MPGSRYPNPLGSHNNLLVIDEGTSARIASPKPSPVGPPPSRLPKPRAYHRIPSSGGRIPTLSKGVQDDYVRWLQILLNLHHASKPPLKPDGYFGPKTLEAVLKFQQRSDLKADGVVGLKTWMKVQLIQAELPQSEPEGAATQHYVAQVQAPAAPAPPSIADWSLTRRFLEVVTVLVPRHLGPELAAQFRVMLTPTNIAILVTTLTAWAVSHAFGVGEAVDLILTVVGVIFMGMAVFKAGRDIGECLVITVDAKEYSDLDKAGDRLAEAIAILGVVAFFALIAKVGAKLREKGSASEGGGEPTSSDKPAKSANEETEADSARRQLKSSLDSPQNGITPDRIRAGDPNKIAVIGRSMSKAVDPYAEGLSSEGYNVETFTGDKISPEATAEWNDLIEAYKPNRIPADVLPDTKMFQENQAWAQKLVDKGYTVVDVGNPSGEGTSPFYEMEKQTIFGN